MPLIRKQRNITNNAYTTFFSSLSSGIHSSFQDMYRWLNTGAIAWNLVDHNDAEATVEGEYYEFDLQQGILLGEGNFHAEGYPVYTSDNARYIPILMPKNSNLFGTESQTAATNANNNEEDIISNFSEFVNETSSIAKDILDTDSSKPVVFLVPYINSQGNTVLINMQYTIDTDSISGVKLEANVIDPHSNGQIITSYDHSDGHTVYNDMVELIKTGNLPKHKEYTTRARRETKLVKTEMPQKKVVTAKNFASLLLSKEEYVNAVAVHMTKKHVSYASVRNKTTNRKLIENKIHYNIEKEKMSKTWTKGIFAKLVLNNYATFAKNKNKSLKLEGQKVWVNDKKYRTIDKFGRLVTVESNTFGNGVSMYVRDVEGKIMYKKRITDVNNIDNNTLSPVERKKELFDLILRKAQAVSDIKKLEAGQTNPLGLPKSYYSTIVNNIDVALKTSCGLDDMQFKYIDGVCNFLGNENIASSETVNASVTNALFVGSVAERHEFMKKSLAKTASVLIVSGNNNVSEISSFTGGLLDNDTLTTIVTDFTSDFSQCGNELIDNAAALNAVESQVYENLNLAIASAAPTSAPQFKTILELSSGEKDSSALQLSKKDKDILTKKDILFSEKK